MQISSVDQSYLLSLYTNAKSRIASDAAVAQASAGTDSVEISQTAQNIANMPPPPHEMDFENMSDDELKDYLQQMYEITGIVPGADGSVEDLSEEDLLTVRATLVEMAQNSPVSEMMSSEKASQFSAEDFQTLLTMFMLSLQSGLSSTTSSDSSSQDLLFSGGETDLVMQMLLERMLSSLADSETSQEQTQAQQAVAAYEQNTLSV